MSLCKSLARPFLALVVAGLLPAVPASADLPLQVAAGQNTTQAAVAYDTTRDRYFVVYQTSFGHLEGQIRNADGTAVDDYIFLLDGSGGYALREPRVTYKEFGDLYLVVFVQARPAFPELGDLLVAAFRAADGRFLWIHNVPGAAATVVTPDVVADTFPHECCILITWQEGRGTVRAQQMHSTGAFRGSITIHNESGSSDHAFFPRVAYQRSPRDQFLIAYKHVRSTADSVVEARVVAPETGLLGSRQVLAWLHEDPVLVRGERFRGGLDIAYDEVGDFYLVSWLDRSSLRGMVLHPGGGPESNPRTFFTETTADKLGNGTPEVIAASGTSRFYVSHARKREEFFGASRPGWWMGGWSVDFAGNSASRPASTITVADVTAAPAGGWSAAESRAFVAWQRQEPRIPPGPYDLYYELEPLP